MPEKLLDIGLALPAPGEAWVRRILLQLPVSIGLQFLVKFHEGEDGEVIGVIEQLHIAAIAASAGYTAWVALRYRKFRRAERAAKVTAKLLGKRPDLYPELSPGMRRLMGWRDPPAIPAHVIAMQKIMNAQIEEQMKILGGPGLTQPVSARPHSFRIEPGA